MMSFIVTETEESLRQPAPLDAALDQVESLFDSLSDKAQGEVRHILGEGDADPRRVIPRLNKLARTFENMHAFKAEAATVTALRLAVLDAFIAALEHFEQMTGEQYLERVTVLHRDSLRLDGESSLDIKMLVILYFVVESLLLLQFNLHDRERVSPEMFTILNTLAIVVQSYVFILGLNEMLSRGTQVGRAEGVVADVNRQIMERLQEEGEEGEAG